ncbi:NUDIX hydrolase [Nonomuraea sp. NPDC050691]|uniref:NUDIX hydrolase n=1 Tax=Nonomuraea sp. NPDC050691 TaxID=3155661 RepID=UPI00340E8B8A
MVRRAVACVLLTADARVVLHRRGPACHDEVGMIEPLGGEVDAGESLLDALHREVTEEAGDLLLRVVRPLTPQRLTVPDTRGVLHRWLVHPFLALLLGGEPSVREPEYNAGFVFVPMADVLSQPLTKLCGGLLTESARSSLAEIRGEAACL